MIKLKSFLPTEPIDWVVRPIERFMHIESITAIFLFVATTLAIIISNSPWSKSLLSFWDLRVALSIGEFQIAHSLRDWINHGLMTLFFFVLSLELKRELVLGELRQHGVAALAVIASIGGMVAPALIYWALQYGLPGQSGWATVISTDTAFLVACMFLLGKSIPYSLRVFLIALAIVDDVGAVLVVSLSDLQNINWIALALSVAAFTFIGLISKLGIRSLVFYCVGGILAWLLVDASQIHPTITGVVLGLMTPTTKWASEERVDKALKHFVDTDTSSQNILENRQRFRVVSLLLRESLTPVEQLEYMLHPWVGFLILPIFALANAGVVISSSNILDPITVTTIISYLSGKPIGIVAFSFIAVSVGIAKLPEGFSWTLLTGAAFLMGIGFTMSIYIANLTFTGSQLNASKMGIILASIASMLVGMVIIKFASNFAKNNA